MRIALDVMGTDNHPIVDIQGGILATKEANLKIIMIGNEPQIKQELNKHNVNSLNIDIIHTEEKILMTDTPSLVIKSKSHSSMHIGLELVKSKQADAFVTAGNTGATLAIATLNKLQRIRGIKRPALAAVYPFRRKPVTILDIGANSECKPQWLVQFAIMGRIYSENVLGIQDPRIALISADHANQLTIESDQLLGKEPNLNYIGQVKPNKIMDAEADVIVSDGFIGNILLKSFESSMSFTGKMVSKEIKSDVISSLGGLLLKPMFSRLKKQLNPSEFGGAHLLGLNGVVIIGHGGADPTTIKNTIFTAKQSVEKNVVSFMQDAFK